jgi:hypothetical protein
MLDLIGSVAGLMAVGVDLVAVAIVLPLSLGQRLILGGALGAWTGLASGVGAAGLLAFAPEQPVPLVGVLAAAPLLTVGALALAYPGVRRALLGVPTSLLIGLNSLRVVGALFLALAAVGRLSGPFPYFAGAGDVITGVFAIPLAFAVARGSASPGAIARWNAFGALDLIVAVSLGLTSANGSPVQIFHAGVGSEAVQLMPFCLVPTVLVPFYLITHAVVAAQLIVGRRSAGVRPAVAGAAS